MTKQLQSVTHSRPGDEHRFSVRVYYEDTDMGGIVYHANYLKFIERARSDWVRGLGVDQVAMKEDGIAFAVRRVEADYLMAAKKKAAKKKFRLERDRRSATPRLCTASPQPPYPRFEGTQRRRLERARAVVHLCKDHWVRRQGLLGFARRCASSHCDSPP